MYCKLFASLYQGTLRGRSNEILVFTNLIANADQYGIVDKHFRAIAEEVGLSIDQVRQAIENLEAPDPESRSPEESGARIVKVDQHRIWGWRIVNYVKYRQIRSEEDRREQNRLAQERFRNKNKPQSATVSHGKPQSAQAEAEAEAEAEEEGKVAAPPISTQFEEVRQGWNDMAKKSGLAICMALSEPRKKSLKARLADPFFREHWRNGLELVSKSEFCCGVNDRGWKADFDWFISPSTINKIVECKYANKGAVKKTRSFIPDAAPKEGDFA